MISYLSSPLLFQQYKYNITYQVSGILPLIFSNLVHRPVLNPIGEQNDLLVAAAGPSLALKLNSATDRARQFGVFKKLSKTKVERRRQCGLVVLLNPVQIAKE